MEEREEGLALITRQDQKIAKSSTQRPTRRFYWLGSSMSRRFYAVSALLAL